MTNQQLEQIRGTHVNAFGGSIDEYELIWSLEVHLKQTDLGLVYIQNIINSVKWAVQQAERYQELEKLWEHDTWQLAGEIRLRKELERQNKRYREYLEQIRHTGTYGTDIETGEIIRSEEAHLADEALEDDNND